MLLPSSQDNVLVQCKKTLSEGLKKMIKLTFQ